MERRTVFKAALAAGASGLVAACTSGGGVTSGNAQQAAAPTPPVAKITAVPAVNATDASVLQPVVVKVADGKLTEVKLTANGTDVKGALAADGLSWASSEPLGYGKTYTYAATATGTDNKIAQLTGSFSTVKPATEVRATVNPVDNAEVGVAMPISVKFVSAVVDQAAAEKALTVQTSNNIQGSWAWLSNTQADWRPKDYWPANIEVNVTAAIYGVNLGGGNYGKSDVSTKFRIGRNQVVKIHTPDHVMKVYRDGSEYRSYPCSNGLDSVLDRNTPNGTFIVMEKKPTAIFDNARYGYTNVNKKWACRISNNGEFIHENQDNAAAIGKTNNSHGCVNLLDADAHDYFNLAIVGDPVEINGSNLPGPIKSDVKDWLFDWPTWKSMSAIK
jgi:lipoprotein-anchoring transpeptidase ErfK/SrfK